MLDLFDWQGTDVRSFAHTVQTTGGGLLAWCPGSGKTLASLEILRLLKPRRVLIIAPLSTHDSWIRTSEGQGLTPIRKVHKKDKAGRAALDDFETGWDGWYIVSPQLMTRSDVTDWGVDVIVADEVHQYVERTSKGLKNLLKIDSSYRVALSGTPARNKVENLWGVSRFLWPDRNYPSDLADENFFRWAEPRLTMRMIYTNQRDEFGNPKKAKKFEGEQIPGAIFEQMPLVIAHHARERCCDAHPEGVLAALKKPVVMEETIELLPEQRRAIREMESQLVTFLDENPMIAEIPLTAKQRVRQCILGVPTVEWSVDDEGNEKQSVSFAPDCKSPYIERLKEILTQDDETYVVWVSSAKFASVVVKRLNDAGIKTDEYSGSRKAGLQGFGKDYRVLVAIPAASGTGTDGLQAVCRSEVWLERDLDETTNEQATSRLFRTGQERGIRRWIFHDDLGISEDRFGEALTKRLALNESLRLAS